MININNLMVYIILIGSLLQGSDLKSELARLKSHNQYEIIQTDANTLHFKHRLTGKEKFIDISTKALPTASDDMQFFDLINADTNLYRDKYLFDKNILVSGSLGYPLVFGDINQNGQLDLTGSYKLEQDYEIGE